MNEQFRESAWYSQDYASQQNDKGRKKRRTRKIVMLCICAAILIGAILYLVFNSLGHIEVSVNTPGVSIGNSDDLPDSFDEFKEFIEGYYAAPISPESSKMELGEPDPNVSVSLGSADGMEELSLQTLYRQCSDSIVGIKCKIEGYRGYGWASGVIATEDGYIITNQHVVENKTSCTVILTDGREFEAKLIGEDSLSDLAVLKIEASGLPVAQFGNSEELTVGDEVVAIGNPLGEEFSGTMTNGIISAINRDMNYDGRRQTLLQTTTAINEGSSGGALFNMYGQVIGITNMKMVNRYSEVSVEGICFAIPTSTVKPVCDQLIHNGKVLGRPGIGITCGALDEVTAKQYNLPDAGLLVTAVNKGCDAEKKGIRPGDVITHVNGEAVFQTEDVLAIRDQFAPGDTLSITIFRDGKSFDVPVVLYDQNQN